MLKQTLRFLKGIANLPWMASELSNPQLDTSSCDPRTNLVMCIWPGSASWLHTLAVRQVSHHSTILQYFYTLQ